MANLSCCSNKFLRWWETNTPFVPTICKDYILETLTGSPKTLCGTWLSLEIDIVGFHLSFQASAVIGKKTYIYIYTTDGRRNLCIKPAPAAAWFVPFQQAQRVVRSLMAKCSREKCGEMDVSKIGIPKTLHRIAILLLFQWYIDD